MTSASYNDDNGAHTNDPTLKDLFTDMWKARWYVLICLIFFISACVAFIANAPGYYRVSMLIGPSQSPLETVSPQRLQAHGGALLSPADFLQVAHKDVRRDSFTRLETILKGSAVAQSLANQQSVIDGIQNDYWARISDRHDMNVSNLREYLETTIRIRRVSDTSLRKIIYHSPDKEFGSLFLKKIVEAANDHIKNQDKSDITNRISHLIDALQKTSNPSQKKALAFLLTLEEQRLMLTSSEKAYAAQIIDPPAVSSKPVWPNTSLFLAVATITGILIGYIAFITVRLVKL